MNKKVSNDETLSYIKIDKSLIPKAGKGLFATTDIPQGIFITYYSGVILDEFPEDNPLYAFELRIPTNRKKGLYIDGSKPIHKDHLGYLINHYPKGKNVDISYNSNPKRNPNRLIKFISTRKIKKGEEIYWDYGPDYWSDKPTPSSPISRRREKE